MLDKPSMLMGCPPNYRRSDTKIPWRSSDTKIPWEQLMRNSAFPRHRDQQGYCVVMVAVYPETDAS